MDSNSFFQLQVTGIIHETSDAKTFVLAPLHGWQPVYSAGQFLTLVFQTKHGEKRRSYSLSSAPGLGESLQITVKRVENGEFSRLLLSHARVGDVLYTAGITGFFTLPQDPAGIAQFLFFAAGSGITPCYALIKTLLATTDKKLVLIYSNKTETDTIFKDPLVLLSQQYPDRFKLHFLFSDRQDVYRSRLSNWLLQQLLVQYVSVPVSRALFYMCGPFEYMQMIQITLLNMQVAATAIRKEQFSTLPRIIQPVPPDTTAHTVLVHFQHLQYSLRVQYPQTVLAAAKANGIRLPYSCEAGRCGSCAATAVKGKFWMGYNEVLMEEELARGRILCCQAYPVEGDGEIIV